VKSWLRAPTLSPKGLVVRAAVCALAYGFLTLAGARAYMSVLCLTYPEGSSRPWAVLVCMAYLVAYFLWILGVPILLLAAALLRAWEWRDRPPAS
jgi:hypothetical protein